MTERDYEKGTSKEEIQDELQRLKKAARGYCQKGEYQTALIYTKRIQKLAHEISDVMSEGQASLLKAQIYFTKGDQQKTLELTKQTIRQFSGIPFIQASGFNIIGLINLNNGNFKESLKNFKKALRKMKKIENGEIRSTPILNNLTIIYRIKGDFNRSLATLNQIIKSSLKRQDNLSLLLAYGNAGNLYLDFLMYKEAIEKFESCIFCAKKISARKHILEALPQLAESLIMLGEYDRAEKEIQKAKKLSKKLGITQLIALTKTISALWLYKAKGDHTGALVLVNEVNQLFKSSEKLMDFEYLIKNLAVKIMMEIDLNLFQEALVDIEEALKITKKSNSIVHSIIFLNLKGLIKSSESYFKDAEDLLKTAIQLASNHGIDNHLEKTQMNLKIIQKLEKANKAYDVAISEQQKKEKMNMDKEDMLLIIKDYIEYALPKIS